MPVVTSHNGEVMADSRDVASFFTKNHKDVLKAVRAMECSPEFERRNFAPFRINDLSGESTSHVLMTKNGFTFLAMGFTGSKAAKFKEAYIERFDAMEAELHSRPVPQTREQIMASALLLADQTMKEQAEQIATLAPKAEALDRIASADGSLSVTEAAKALQVRPKDLFAFLSTNSWIYRRAGSGTWLGYQTRTNSGDLHHLVTTKAQADGTEMVIEQVKVTPRGLAKLAKLMPGQLAAA
jgi:Rha family phage regulatory protein